MSSRGATLPLSKAPIDQALRAAFVGKRDFNLSDFLTITPP